MKHLWKLDLFYKNNLSIYKNTFLIMKVIHNKQELFEYPVINYFDSSFPKRGAYKPSRITNRFDDLLVEDSGLCSSVINKQMN